MAYPFDVTGSDGTTDALARVTDLVGDVGILVPIAGVPDDSAVQKMIRGIPIGRLGTGVPMSVRRSCGCAARPAAW
ncbi:hypothetical protein [Prescottella sp. R16]|uniref:hypothetical protein n=1 Tax=Prescottella sp. R16 TaxID=3064529 RepID=UPI00272E548E|nr:hypothetical protein [Prescottella sp. R16]